MNIRARLDCFIADHLKGGLADHNKEALVCLGPKLLHDALNATSHRVLEQLVMPKVHIGHPASIMMMLSTPQLFHENDSIPNYAGQDRQPNASRPWALLKYVEDYARNPYSRTQGHCMWYANRLYVEWGLK